MDTFKYLVLMLYFDDSDWNVVGRDLQIAWRKKGRFSQLLGREGDDTRTSGRFYVVVFQSVLIFGSESWVITPRILQALGSLHNWLSW